MNTATLSLPLEEQRARVLLQMRTPLHVARELLQDDSSLALHVSSLPLPDEAHLLHWQTYADEGASGGWQVLRRVMPQLAFPVRAGMSSDPTYIRATRQGRAGSDGSGIQMRSPETLQIHIHESSLGRLPVVLVPERADFVSLVQAIVHRNEPVRVPDDVGALLVSGYVNWDRVAHLRVNWAAAAHDTSDAAWAEELRHYIQPHPALYHDRFVIATEMPYSGLSAERAGQHPDQWRADSRTIRLHHEHMHATVQRLSGRARSHLHDELLADYYALGEMYGQFQSELWLACLGLDAPGEGHRWEYYAGRQQLSPLARPVVAELLRRAARTLETLEQQHPEIGAHRALAALRLLSVPLELIAVPDSLDTLAATCLPAQGNTI